MSIRRFFGGRRPGVHRCGRFSSIKAGCYSPRSVAWPTYQGTVNGEVSISLDSGNVNLRLQLVDLQLGVFMSRFADVAGIRGG